MHMNDGHEDRLRELERLLEIADRKTDVLTGLLMEANAEYEGALARITRSEHNFRAIFETAPEPIYLIDSDTNRIIDCNDFTLYWLGYSRDELISAPSDSIVEAKHESSGDSSEDAPYYRRTALVEWCFRKKDGTIAIAEVAGTPLEYRGRQCFAILAHDITARKRAEEALRRSEANYRAIFDSMNDSILVQDIETAVVLDVNRKVCEDFGCTREEAIRLTLSDFCSGEPPYTPENALARHMRAADGELTVFEWHGKKAGEPHWVEVSLKRALIDGEPRMLTVVRDIEERKKAEEEREKLRSQLIQSQKLEALGTLTGGIAHDFNNMLAIILGYSELCLCETSQEDPRYQDLERIVETAHKGADLVKRLLTFGKRTPPSLRPIDLNAEIKQFESFLARAIPKMIEIKLELSDDLAPIQADTVQIDQILMNLAINAKDAMPEGGKLVIETKNVALDGDFASKRLGLPPGDYVCVIVSDTGHGMDADTRARVFEPFFTTKGRDSRKGTGLGLSVVKAIVEQHGGNIICYSEPHVGTSFRLYFPAIVHGGTTMAFTDSDVLHRTGTILLVDDEELVLGLGERILRKAGYRVITATNGEEALKRYATAEEKISLVILDLIMPGMGGKQCLQKLLQIDPNVKVVIASGYSVIEDGDETLTSGWKGFVCKPYNMRELLQTVHQALARP